MFYKTVETAFKAGKVRVGLPALGHGNDVSVEAGGLIGLKALFLSRAERQMLADLSRSNAMAMKDAEAA